MRCAGGLRVGHWSGGSARIGAIAHGALVVTGDTVAVDLGQGECVCSAEWDSRGVSALSIRLSMCTVSVTVHCTGEYSTVSSLIKYYIVS